MSEQNLKHFIPCWKCKGETILISKSNRIRKCNICKGSGKVYSFLSEFSEIVERLGEEKIGNKNEL